MEWSNIFSPMNITIGVLILSSIFFMKGKVRADLVALCSMLILLISGILTPSEALAGFSNNVVIMMVGLFIVGAGIFRTGLAKMVSSKIVGLAGNNETVLFLLIMLVTAGVGAFVSNTGTVAVMMPIVMSMAVSANINPKRYLMPLAFASSMGLFTLISTPPNLVINQELIDNNFEALSFFSFAPIGFICLGAGTFILFFLSKLLIKKDSNATLKSKKQNRTLQQLVDEYNLQQQSRAVIVPANSKLVGKSLAELQIRKAYNVSISKIVTISKTKLLRKKFTEEIAGPNTLIIGGSTLYCLGEKKDIEHFVNENKLQFDNGTNNESLNFQESGIAEAYILPNSTLVNKTILECQFRETYGVNVIGIKRNQEYRMSHVEKIKLNEGDALLLQGTWQALSTLDGHFNDLVLVGQPLKEASKVTLDQKAPITALIMLLMIIAMVTNIIPPVAAVLTAAVAMIITGCLRNMEEAYNSINWGSIVLIAAMMPMAVAFEKTGITNIFANFLNTSLGDMGPLALLAGVYCSTSLLTMVVSNTATAVLFAPIAMKAAMSMGYQPQPFMFAVAVAASMCFASPFSTPPNALVMNAGGYTFMDYIKVGLPLQLVMGVIMVLMLPLLFPF